MSGHQAQALAHIEQAVDANQNGNWQTAQFEIKLALVESNLAIAEQQRIANLIAFQTPGGGMPSNGSYNAAEVLDNEWANKIREGLGLA